MPVTIHPATHGANLHPDNKFAKKPGDLLYRDTKVTQQCKQVLQDSFGPGSSRKVVGASNGFVQACISAYSDHYHLVIRPDDVWTTILTQLSLYVNANAEALRSHFVSHEGQETIAVSMDGDRHSVSWAEIASKFTDELGDRVNDPKLKDWILQSFSTTTDTDRAVSAITMMGTLQAYFSYKAYLKCGIPSVTLQGTREDWVQLRDAVANPSKLPTFGKETAEWSRVLHTVLTRFVTSFDDPTSSRTRSFWQNIAHYSGGGSGPRYWSGWITAFCFWNKEGEYLRGGGTNIVGGMLKSTLPRWVGSTTLRIGGQVFHKINSNEVPPAWVSVPVTVNELGVEFKAKMVAGVVGYSVSESGQKLENGGTGLDTVRPETAWWMYEERAGAD
jgi:Domain of unknown function (DUF4419)